MHQDLPFIFASDVRTNCQRAASKTTHRLTLWRGYVHGVEVGRRLVQQQDAGLAEDGAGQTHQLFVPVAQDAASVLQLEIQPVGKLLDHGLQAHLMTHVKSSFP